jgi:hypothetical protein
MNYEHEQNKKEMKSFANKVKVDDSQIPRTNKSTRQSRPLQNYTLGS